MDVPDATRLVVCDSDSAGPCSVSTERVQPKMKMYHFMAVLVIDDSYD